ncbi:cytochrome c-type biogenesis protein CcsB [Thermocrinis albus DSM 14484]|uniref:Cytochrome c-type biogenesis protein CcsB n=1 Tax=Thermocrinis albus (strain DSM 14484 / JCM 11386 / HI 11/12) TaxID=638303 RepID=D3SQ32_THEAH|nr:cytochrome c biogenesis protein [Thermocrinis albus]ADC89269.1 cytochrome c-type biogenesis protein CcsB [Thermocrinis albus DSM 14484]
MREVGFEERKVSGTFFALGGLTAALLLFLMENVILKGISNVLWYRFAFGTYAIAAVLYVLSFIFRKRKLENLSSFVLYAGLVFNLTGMMSRGWESYQMGAFHPPWSNLFEALTFWSFVVGVLYLLLEKSYNLRVLGVFVVPIMAGLSGFAIFYASHQLTPLMPALRSYWLYLHVVTAFIGYAGFTVAFGAAVLYLLRDRIGGLPSEDTLDEITYRAIVLVFPVWTLSIILGAMWASEAWGGYWSWDPKEVWSLIVWLFFGAYLHARHMLGWRGKRTAWMVVAGFVTVLVCFFAINLFFPGLHSYATD